MFKLLIDTCVWLDIANDRRQAAVLDTLETLLRDGRLLLLLPQIVVDEFSRNKGRVVEDSTRSLSSSLKRVKDAVYRLGEGRGKRVALEHLQELDRRLPRLGEAAVEAVARIEALFASVTIIEHSDRVILRAADRALRQRAPFHRQRNSMHDAILIEMYAELVNEKAIRGVRFGFVTHNTKDFSHPSSDNRLPHPDIASYFSRIRSLYLINLAEALRRIDSHLITDAMIEREWHEEPRSLADIVAAIDVLTDKVWYDRHQLLKQRIEEGKIALVDSETFPVADHTVRPIQRDVWQGALKGAARVEKKYGIKNLGPWSKFEWGMINGKLSALRWVLGDEWDMLDT
ncbi:MAG: PIN domain-containing protein [Syntrophales bacterium]